MEHTKEHPLEAHVEHTSTLDKAIRQDAQDATEHEVGMSLVQGLRLYPKAVGWSIFLSTAVVMEGFDTVLMNSFYAETPFQKRFGTHMSDGSYEITAPWQVALSNGARVGEIIGLFVNGLVAERLGYRWTMISSLVFLAGFVCLPFFAHNIEMLLAGQILMGIPWGVFQTLSAVYASEVCPVQLRSYLTTYVNLCWVIGQLLGTGVLRGFLNRDDQWSYRIPFAFQWIWPLPLIIGALFAPESPWLLVRKNRLDQAEHSLRRLTTKADESFDPKKTIAMMVATTQHERELSTGTSFIDCFRGTNLRRTEISCLLWLSQALCGAAIMSWSTYFFEQAGLPTEDAFDMSLAQFGVGFIGTFLSWVLMKYYGRRTLYVSGIGILLILLVCIGCTGVAPRHEPTYWASGALLITFTFTYDCTVGPIVYSLVAEMSSVRLRAKTVVLARILFNLGSIVNSVITPYMLNPKAWDWGAKTGFFWAGICLTFFMWSYFRVPEPRGRTYGELDALFEQKIPARKFATAQVSTIG